MKWRKDVDIPRGMTGKSTSSSSSLAKVLESIRKADPEEGDKGLIVRHEPGQEWKTCLRAEPQSANASVFIRKESAPAVCQGSTLFLLLVSKGDSALPGESSV